MSQYSQQPGPIGVFDSGYGGLTILHGIRQLLPETQIISAPSAGHILQFEAVESYPDS